MIIMIRHTYTPLQASSEVLHEPPYKDFADIVGDSFPVLGSPSYKRKTKIILIPKSWLIMEISNSCLNTDRSFIVHTNEII